MDLSIDVRPLAKSTNLVVICFRRNTVTTSYFNNKYLLILSVALFLALFSLPESPVWLEAQGQDPAPAIKWLHLSARATAAVEDDTPE